ncbi:hypothetical protein BJD55_gp033 [Gordonia phage Yvonnetastic]|uniref:Uncharacterized protein n=1 Tax=Gordonia phage Yvonnetastic TaxID=1821566 RepID=A0A142K9F0_9CAUD|nr:hypothetical protein BJD55_gp033 [Gordonia phage Yvonnetastic]AMS02733.1 hypothetical protein SEA_YVONNETASTIC_189 [Gordonia phage Yvonnetastic]
MANIEELTPSNLNPLQRKLNKETMVAWINNDLFNRANVDVRTAHVWYTADKDFLIAAPKGAEVTDSIESALYKLGARYHSVGV